MDFYRENYEQDANLRGKIKLLKILLRRHGNFLKESEQERFIQFSIDNGDKIESERREEPGEPE